MTEGHAMHEANRRWGTEGFASYVWSGGPRIDVYVVGARETPYGVGTAWELVFQDANSGQRQAVYRITDPARLTTESSEYIGPGIDAL